MATLREIRQRISGVKGTQKITKAMKMVAAAKLRRAQDAVIAARPYARKTKELFTHLDGVVEIASHPMFVNRPVNRVAVIVVTADRGLCGAFNSNIIKTAIHHINENYRALNEAGNVSLICVGRKASDFFPKNNYKVALQRAGIFHDLNFGVAEGIITEVVNSYLNGMYDKVEIVYNEFKSIVQQRPVVEQLLPIETTAVLSHPGEKHPHSSVNYIYEPSATEIIDALVPKHLNFQMWRALLESNASEQGARMTAMENATTNATDLIRSLQLSYNKARQAAITKELLEIVGGAEALQNG
jgi:F-type H+-transporting ATPase subunit gamma